MNNELAVPNILLKLKINGTELQGDLVPKLETKFSVLPGMNGLKNKSLQVAILVLSLLNLRKHAANLASSNATKEKEETQS